MNAVVMFVVIDPLKAILAVENYAVATAQIAQTALRSLLELGADQKRNPSMPAVVPVAAG